MILEAFKTQQRTRGIDYQYPSFFNNDLMQIFLNIFKNALGNFKDKKTQNASIMIA